jgi:hypothetical protein
MKIFNIWITGEQLLEGWSAHHRAVYDAVLSGLPVYQDINGEPARIEIDDFKRAYHKMKNTQWFFSELIFNAEDVATFEGVQAGRKYWCFCHPPHWPITGGSALKVRMQHCYKNWRPRSRFLHRVSTHGNLVWPWSLVFNC